MSFQMQADMYNSITPEEVKVKELEERVKNLEIKFEMLQKDLTIKKIQINSIYGIHAYRDTDMREADND